MSEKKNTVRASVTLLLILAVIIVFYLYSQINNERISEQNADYIENAAKQTANWIDDLLESAKLSIVNVSSLYGSTLSSPEVSLSDLQTLADRSYMFDYVEFVNKDGLDMNVQEKNVDVSDRSYFINGMQGKSGMDGAYISKTTDERTVIFYAPVTYEGEIIGVLTGQYREARMRDILETTLFDEPVPSILCARDGTVIASVNADEQRDGDNLQSCLGDMVSARTGEELKNALAAGEEYGFLYRTEKGEANAYMVPVSGTEWAIVQFFPVEALARMQGRANSAGVMLEAELILMFVVYVLVLMFQERRLQRRLRSEKLQAERIIAGVNRLFSRFILVDLKEDAYRYVNGQRPSFSEFPLSGRYSDFLGFFKDKFIEEKDITPMSRVLEKEAIRGALQGDVPYRQYEYRIRRDDREDWELMAVIAIEREEGIPVSVLLAVQETTDIKKQEIRVQNALRDACQAAEAANHAKSDFLSHMSHDIRTPMNAIMGMTALAAINIDNKEKVQDCLSKITVSSRHLLGLINEVLDMSRIESGKLELTNEEFNLSETVDGLLGIFHTQIEGKHQNLSVTLQDVNHERVVGDSQRLSQILINIMGNAVKFTPEGGSIAFHINEIPSHLVGKACYEFIITDNGIGMDEEFVKRIFTPFERASDSRMTKTEGTGLGLSIARNIAMMMNGDIHVKSKKGEGTEIKATVYLEYCSGEDEELDMLAGHKVMVVDDEQSACEYACSILSSIDMPSAWFTDSDEAVRALVEDYEKEGSYVAVILDWKMPGKDGVQVAREIREKIGGGVPIIILSAYDWTSIEKEALLVGVNAFISKPLFKSRLIYVMKQVLGVQKEEEDGAGAVQEEIAVQQAQFSGKRLLLVEDNEMNMEIAFEILTMAGFEVDKAENGQEAVERLTEAEPETYQLVLMDIQMPVMNGYEASRAIRASGREDLKTIPILAMTADAFTEDVKKAAEAGMDGHIAKPIEIDKLMEILQKWV